MFTMAKNVREDDTLTTIFMDGFEVASINYSSNNIGNTEFTVEVALHFKDNNIYVIEKWEHVLGSPESYLKGYIQELLRFLNQFDITKISYDSETCDKIIEKIQSLSNEMLASKAKYFNIAKVASFAGITSYTITKL